MSQKVNQVQIGDTKTAIFWHGSQSLTIFTPKEKVTLTQEETYRLLSFLQAEMRPPIDMSNIEDSQVQARLLAVNEQHCQEDRETAEFYNSMAEAQ